MSRASHVSAVALFLCVLLTPTISAQAGEENLPLLSDPDSFATSDLTAEYDGELAYLIEVGLAEPLSLATADFDEDGVPDLVVGYGDDTKGLFVVHRGNLEAIYPDPGAELGQPFLRRARVFTSSSRPDHIATGDFDADGHFDIVAATMGGATLELHRGDGSGRFAAAETIDLGGRLSAMAVGEVNRRDGLADVVVGIESSSGPKILVFESPRGALHGNPEIIDAFETVTSIELGNHDDDFVRDIAAATESYRIDVKGRDRRLSLGAKQRAEVAAAIVNTEPVSVNAKKCDPPPFAELLNGEILASLPMRLNRDAIPDTVAITDALPHPLVIKSLTLSTFTVDSTADDGDFATADGVCDIDDSVGDGPCTLRAAIEQANASPGADAVDFNIQGTGPHQLTPATEYIEIAMGEPLTIDGYTQPGAAFNTNPPGQGTNAIIMIEIVGGPPTVYQGFSIRAEGSVIRGLAINRIEGTGIGWFTENGSIVEGNFIGTDPTGTVALGNTGVGVFMASGTGHLLGGTAPAARNIISDSGSRGVYIYSLNTADNEVLGNLIGTDATGEVDFGNAEGGIRIDQTSNNTIGGSVTGAGNVISGNGSWAVTLYRSPIDSNVIQGNFIGSNVSGDAIIGCSGGFTHSSYAVNTLIGGTAGTTPGGACTGACNLIVGCGGGISLSSSEGATIQGNHIGISADGGSALGNTTYGIVFSNSLNTSLGGAVANARNVISGNGYYGIKSADSSWGLNTVIQGNYIGTDSSGSVAVPNGSGDPNWPGIYLEYSDDHTIGGPNPGEGNLVSGTPRGIVIAGAGPDGNVVQGNLIGTDATGTNPIGNDGDGIRLVSGPLNNTIGVIDPGEGNIVAFNGGGGIVLTADAGTANVISGNSIFDNTGLGIDLNDDGVTANDPDDPDAGPNNLQNFPVITAVSGPVVTGTLDSLPDTAFDIEFFGNTACDTSTYGEGEFLLGSGTTTTDSNGDAAFSLALTTAAPPGSYVAATATNPDGDTSEFSACFQYLVEADLGVTKDDGVTTAIPGEQLTYTIVAGNIGPDDLVGATVSDVFPSSLSCSWTCLGAGSASCNAGPVAGDIDDDADLPVGGTATYTAICDISPGATGSLSNTATVTAPPGVDPNLANNSDTDIDTVLELDLGDAPDSTYPTLHASDGARHVLGGAHHLGSSVDSEPDGQPTAFADGDDTHGADDEDGVVFAASLLAGADESFQVTASVAGMLNAWIDFNADGDWDDLGEQVFTDEPLVAGSNGLSVVIPLDAAVGTTFARFRFDSAGGLTPTGLAVDGEVEDYTVVIDPSAELEVSIGDSPDPVPEGGRLTFFVSVGNNGQLEATSVVLVDTLPPEVSFVAASLPACIEAGGVVTCDLTTVGAGVTTMVLIEVDVAFGTTGTITNTAVVTLNETDPVLGNNTEEEMTTVVDETTYIYSDGFETGDTSRWSETAP